MPLNQITLLVRTPGTWDGYRSYPEAQRAEAEAYAARMGVTVEPLQP